MVDLFRFPVGTALLLSALIGCSSGSDNQQQGGLSGSGGSATGGGGVALGGAATGGAATGGVAMGGAASGGGATGGAATGGVAMGGAASGGAATGGAAMGGAASGGVATGGAATGGAGTGGAATGGVAMGGAASGGAATGGAAIGGDGAGGAAAGGAPSAEGPCDIYQAGSVPCVAAHSTVRALYGAYDGQLYQVRRSSDQTTRDIGVLSPGGVANSADQDDFCAGTTCTISIIYDQSPQQNHLTRTTGGWIGDFAKEADAAGIKITLNGHSVYGVHIPLLDGLNGTGYRNNEATGTAEGDEPESMYMVANGRAYSSECCFDYGNAERNSLNNGNGTMEAIYFGDCTYWGRGDGSGPWIMADLENGLFSGQGAGLNANDTSLDFDYVTVTLKGQPHQWAIKAGDAQSGVLTTMYEGAYPNGGYDPMQKEGAIVLGTGGDNSYKGVGDFFEGAMTAGYASDATEDALQANIVAAGYGK